MWTTGHGRGLAKCPMSILLHEGGGRTKSGLDILYGFLKKNYGWKFHLFRQSRSNTEIEKKQKFNSCIYTYIDVGKLK